MGKLTPDKIMNLFLVFIPFPIIGNYFGWSQVVIFITACLAIIPLAGLMGRATEYIGNHVGEGLGGLLNATFGNACELIIAFAALRAGLIDVVKASITGSIIGNILLVLGASMLLGGLRYEKQTFNRTAATTSATLLALAAISLLVPAVFHYVSHAARVNEAKLALAISAILFTTYIFSLIFSLKTHKALYGAKDPEEDEAKEHDGWSLKKSLAVLAIATLFVVLLSEYLVHAVHDAAQSLGLTQVFIGLVLVAIVGNAAEHSTAIVMAMKNKMDLSINIALGSSSQIALFVAPILVFASFLMGSPMDLRFTEFEILSVVVSVIVLALVTSDGECNWLEGVQLLAAYTILASAFYFA